MKILHIVHQYLPENVGGTELYTHWTAQGLVQRSNQVAVFHRKYLDGSGLENRTDAAGVQIWSAWSGALSPTKRLLATFKGKNILDAFVYVLDEARPEIIHIQHLMGLPVQFVDAIRQRNIPFVVTLHDYWWVCANAQLLTNYSQQLCDGPKAFLNCARCAVARAGHPQLWPVIPVIAAPLARRNHRLQQVLNAAHKLVAPSEFVRDWYHEYGVDSQKLTVIPHGLNTPLSVQRQPRDSEYPLRFAFVGGLSWQKGIHILLKAFQNINADAELWIAGDESTDPDYVAELRGLASNRVRFLGKLTREEVWETLHQVDVVIVPSMWYEAFSFIISEAFAAGVPVVASKLGPLADRVHHNTDGLLVPPNNPRALQKALQRFADEPDLLPRLQAGIRPVFTFDEHLSEIETLYQTVVSSKSL